MNRYVKIRRIKKIMICSSEFKVIWSKKGNGGAFSFKECTITIGCRDYEKDPLYVMSVISHEIMEIIIEFLGGRFQNGRTDTNYLFNFDHQTFENAIQLHIQAMASFIL